MSHKTSRCLIVASTALLFGLQAPSRAHAQDAELKQQCVAAYQATQELKLDKKLVEAAERAKFCAQEQCPAVVRDGCAKWSVELREATPTIVVTARGADGDLSDVRVYVDDALVAETLGGEAIAIDPGRHAFRFEHGGDTPVEQDVLISVGVHNRTIEVAFGAVSAAPEPDTAAKGEERGLPVAGLVLAGVGVASVVVFAALASIGSSDIDDLRATCGETKSCAEEDVDDAKLKIIVGDVFLGVGVLAVGVGTALIIAHYLSDDAPEESALRWGVAPTPDGVAGGLSFRF